MCSTDIPIYDDSIPRLIFFLFCNCLPLLYSILQSNASIQQLKVPHSHVKIARVVTARYRASKAIPTTPFRKLFTRFNYFIFSFIFSMPYFFYFIFSLHRYQIFTLYIYTVHCLLYGNILRNTAISRVIFVCLK